MAAVAASTVRWTGLSHLVMTTVLAGIPGVVIYLDDIVVLGPTMDIHDEHLNKVFDALAKHNLTMNAEKCLFAVPVIEFVGFNPLGSKRTT